MIKKPYVVKIEQNVRVHNTKWIRSLYRQISMSVKIPLSVSVIPMHTV